MNNTTTLNKLKSIKEHILKLDYLDPIFSSVCYDGIFLNLDYDFNSDNLLYRFHKEINDDAVISIQYKRNHYESNKNKVLHIIDEDINYLETGFCKNYEDYPYYENKYGKINNKMKN